MTSLFPALSIHTIFRYSVCVAPALSLLLVQVTLGFAFGPLGASLSFRAPLSLLLFVVSLVPFPFRSFLNRDNS